MLAQHACVCFSGCVCVWAGEGVVGMQVLLAAAWPLCLLMLITG